MSRASELTVTEVASLRQTNRYSAYKWLVRNGRAHLRKRGRVWVIRRAAFFAMMQRERVLLEPALEQRVRALEEAVREQDRRLDVHAAAMSRLHML